MKTIYFILAFVSLLSSIVFTGIDIRFRWVATGFGITMLLLGLFSRNKNNPMSPTDSSAKSNGDAELQSNSDNLNKIGGTKK